MKFISFPNLVSSVKRFISLFILLFMSVCAMAQEAKSFKVTTAEIFESDGKTVVKNSFLDAVKTVNADPNNDWTIEIKLPEGEVIDLKRSKALYNMKANSINIKADNKITLLYEYGSTNFTFSFQIKVYNSLTLENIIFKSGLGDRIDIECESGSIKKCEFDDVLFSGNLRLDEISECVFRSCLNFSKKFC